MDDLKSYDVPATENLTPEQADVTLKKLSADAIADPQHPYTFAHHSQHGDFVTAITELHEIKGGGKVHDPTGDACREAMAEQQDHTRPEQVKRCKMAAEEMNKLVNLDYERAAIPDDISQRQFDVLKMQRLCAEQDFDSLTPMVEKSLRQLNVPSKVMSQYHTVRNMDDNIPGIRQEMLEKIISWINEEHKKHERKR